VMGFKVAKAQVTDPSALDVFNQWGLDSVTLGFGVDYSWNAEQKSALLKQADIKIDELGDLTLSADFSGIEKAETVMQTGALKHAVLRYTDASLTGRTLKIVAAGGDPVEYARELALAIQAQSAIFGNTEAVAAAAKAIGAFLVDPHHLTIEASPPQPLTLAAFDAVRRSPPSEIFLMFQRASILCSISSNSVSRFTNSTAVSWPSSLSAENNLSARSAAPGMAFSWPISHRATEPRRCPSTRASPS
jgi:hypothetical protein